MARFRLSRHVSLLRFLHRRVSLVASATSGTPFPLACHDQKHQPQEVVQTSQTKEETVELVQTSAGVSLSPLWLDLLCCVLAAAGSWHLDVSRALLHPRLGSQFRSLNTLRSKNPRSQTYTNSLFVFVCRDDMWWRCSSRTRHHLLRAGF